MSEYQYKIILCLLKSEQEKILSFTDDYYETNKYFLRDIEVLIEEIKEKIKNEQT